MASQSHNLCAIPAGSIGSTATRTAGRAEATWGNRSLSCYLFRYLLTALSLRKCCLWSWREELNLQPAVYKNQLSQCQHIKKTLTMLMKALKGAGSSASWQLHPVALSVLQYWCNGYAYSYTSEGRGVRFR